MKNLILIAIVFLCSAVYAQTKYEIDSDGFPAGQNSPEGVACDAIRAYINSDHELWLSVLLPSRMYGDKRNPGGEENIRQYEEFKTMMVEKKKQNAKDPNFPKMKIVEVYKARNFSANGPSSLAYALLEMHGNMFVDVLVDTGGVNIQLVRSHVMQDKNKIWYFEPRPDLMPFFASGLNEESASIIEWGKE